MTDQQQTEEALRLSEQRNRSLVEATAAIVWTLPPSGIADESPQPSWSSFTGQTPDQYTGWGWLKALHPDDQVTTFQDWSAAVETRAFFHVEYRVRRYDGEYRNMLTRAVPIFGKGGELREWFGTCIDVTELKRAQEALRESEERFRGTFENAAVGIAHANRSGRFLRVNEKFCAILGYTHAELLQMTFREVTHPDDHAASTESFAALMRSELPAFGLEKRYLRKDGSIIWAQLTVSLERDATGKPAYAIAVIQDITERNRLEVELRQTNALLQGFADGTQDAVYVKDRVGRYLMFNAAASRMVGKPIAEVLGRDDTAIFDPDSAHEVMAHDRRVMESAVATTKEDELSAGGVTRTYLSSKAPYRDAQGNVIGLIGISHDITGRKRAEEALRESEQRWRSLTEALPQLVWANMPDGTMIYASAQVEQYLGRPESELLAWGWMEVLHPDDRERTEQAWRAALAGQRKYEIEHRLRRFDGTYRWFKTRGIAVRDGAGHVCKWFGTCTDITDLKQAEQALRESEERWRSLAEALPQFVWTDTPDGYCDYLSTQWEKYTGVPAAEHLGWRWMEALHPDDTERARHRWTEAVAGRADYDVEFRIRRADGEYRWFKARGVPVRDSTGGIVKWFGTCTDISDLRQTQEALHQANARVELAVRSSNIGIWECDIPDGRIENSSVTVINVWEMLGYEAQTMPANFSAGFARCFHPDDAERAGREMKEFLAGDGHEWENEFRVLSKDGSTRWHLSRGTVVRTPEGKPVRFIGASADITDLKRAEEALQTSERRFRVFVDHAADAFFLRDEQGHILDVNRRACEDLGYTRDELIGMSAGDLDPELAPSHLEEIRRKVIANETFAYEARVWRKDRTTIPVEVRGRAFQEGGRCYVVTLARDVTERKQFEEELRRAKEAAEAANRAKDEFLANVSHEIRTPMNAIIGMTELVLDTPLDEGQRQGLKTVKSAADNLLSIINDLLDFSKIEAGKLELVPEDFSLRAAVGDTLRALAVRAHKKGLELIYQVQPDVPDALIGDAGRLRQVLLNLVGNAVKFTDEGEVEVRVDIVGDDPPAHPPAGSVGLRFTVRDTGIGIPPDQQERIFRAFEQEDTSTTRKYGGTGLGLTIAARLVALMGGTITVDSALGRGSTFAFTALFGQQPHSSEAVPPPPPVSLHHLPVLVVDDNATNRHILAQWLRDWQMDATAVSDGMAAMDALWHRAANGRPYSLVLLDARMPDADGLTVAARIRERVELAATRIILLTSGERPGDPARFRELRIDAQLLKPVQQDELLETIYRVMSYRAGHASKAAQPAAAQAAHEPVQAATAIRVLLAEDNELNAEVLEQLLIRHGYQVRLASDGREALALAQTNDFDLLLLDIHMPELDGFDVVRAIRQREQTTERHLPVVALTARSRKEDRQHCLSAGMDDFLTKPVRAADLWPIIDRVLRKDDGRRLKDLPKTPPRTDSPVIPHPSSSVSDLLDARILLAACGGDPVLLAKMCKSLTVRAPEQLTAIHVALRDKDTRRLREVAHKSCGLLSEFSSLAGDVASDLEDRAAAANLAEAQQVAEMLSQRVAELLRLTDGLTLDRLKALASTGS